MVVNNRLGLSPTDVRAVEALAAAREPPVPQTRVVFHFCETSGCVKVFDVDLVGATEIACFDPASGWR